MTVGKGGRIGGEKEGEPGRGRGGGESGLGREGPGGRLWVGPWAFKFF